MPYSEIEDQEPWYEPEDCEECLCESDESGYEYEQDFRWEAGIWVCNQCGQPN